MGCRCMRVLCRDFFELVRYAYFRSWKMLMFLKFQNIQLVCVIEFTPLSRTVSRKSEIKTKLKSKETCQTKVSKLRQTNTDGDLISG